MTFATQNFPPWLAHPSQAGARPERTSLFRSESIHRKTETTLLCLGRRCPVQGRGQRRRIHRSGVWAVLCTQVCALCRPRAGARSLRKLLGSLFPVGSHGPSSGALWGSQGTHLEDTARRITPSRDTESWYLPSPSRTSPAPGAGAPAHEGPSLLRGCLYNILYVAVFVKKMLRSSLWFSYRTL